MIKATTMMVLIGMICTTVFAGGKDGEKVTRQASIKVVSATDAETYNLVYQSETPGKVKVDIINERGKLVLRDRIFNKNGFSRPYNFTELPAGIYTLKVSNGDQFLTETFDYKPRIVNQNLEISAARVGDNQNKIKLTVKGIRNDRIKVNIYNRFNRLVAEDEIEAQRCFSRIYDLCRYGCDRFTFEVVDKNNEINTVVCEAAQPQGKQN